MNNPDIKLYVLCLTVAATILAFDLAIPLGAAIGVPYVALVLMSWWGTSEKLFFVMASLGTALTVIGYVLSPEGGVLWAVIVNRAIAIVVIWTTAVILLMAKRAVRVHLDTAERDYVDLVHNAPVGIISVTPAGKFISVNPAFAALLGYDSPEELMESVTDVQAQLYVDHEQRPAIIGMLEENYQSLSEYELYRKDGSTIWISEIARAIHGKDGEIIRYEGFVSDITERKGGEARLEETRSLLAQSEKMAKFGYWICEHDTFTYPLWSNGLESIYELDPDRPRTSHKSALNPDKSALNPDISAQGGSVLDEMSLIHPDDQEMASEAFKRLVTKGEMIDCEYRIVLPNGKLKWLHDVGIAIDFEGGKYKRSYGTTQDITERKNNEIRLEEINTFLSQASKLAETGHWICEHEGFTYPYWSEEMDEIFGLGPKDNDKATEGVPNFGNDGMIHPDDVDRVQASFSGLIADGVPMDIEYRIVRSDGEVRWIREIGIATDYKDGRYGRSYGTTQDITDRIHVEQSLRETLKLNETILADSPVGISFFDETGQCILTNNTICDIIGATRDGVLSQNYHNIDSWKRSGLYDVALECLKTGEARKYEMQEVSSFGKQFFVECHLAPIDLDNKRHLLFMMTDIADQKMLQVQLIQQSKMATLGEMATGMAHELNQPLNVIRMAVHNVLRKIGKNTVEPDYLSDKLVRIDQQVDRASSIIDHMRVFGRRAEIDPVQLDPREVVDGTLGLIGEQLRIAGIDVVLDMPETCPAFMGHQVQIEQILLNLLGNARDQIEGRDGEKRITVAVTHDDHDVQIAVEDTGGGIPEDLISRIFEPFFTTKEAGVGTGLGLSISYGIIIDMGGRIVAANTDHGARFTITLPMCGDDT
ncbi:MAG: PAS domain S-box protein, partial [Rhodospirillales bacterium]|nr:PAS domain S-box protein [Rhodospirillales bacterium]